MTQDELIEIIEELIQDYWENEHEWEQGKPTDEEIIGRYVIPRLRCAFKAMSEEKL